MKNASYRWAARIILAALLAVLLAPAGTVFAQDDTPGFAVPLDHPAAPFLESVKYATAQGATAEWRKMEGVAVDEVNNRLYIAVSKIANGMSDQEGNIQLAENACGAVYMAELNDNYDISNLTAVVVGGPYDETDEDNPCPVDAIANPDNLYVDANGVLWIGEDTSKHANNVLWTWDGSELKRFATVPAGAEVTGLRVEKDGTVFMNVQHPDGNNFYPYNRGIVGVINGFKAGDEFTPIPVPEGDDMHRVVVAAGEYQPLGRVGEAVPNAFDGARFGQIRMADGSPMMCNDPDGNMYLPIDSTGAEGYLYTNYECVPSMVSKLYIRQNADGGWDVLEGEMDDMKSIKGSWDLCNASVTPWNTGLTSEEYPPDVNAEWVEAFSPMSELLGQQANPYDYGYLIELVPDSIGTEMAKHYAMGRFSHELAVVMPDGKTVYNGDDGKDKLLWKFVADEAGDLSSGTLYAAKVTQADAENGGSFDLEWIELGSGNDDDLYEVIREIDAQLPASE